MVDVLVIGVIDIAVEILVRDQVEHFPLVLPIIQNILMLLILGFEWLFLYQALAGLSYF